MTVKELLQLSRDVVLVIFLLYAFTADLYLAASGISLQLERAPLTVVDMDLSAASRDLVSRFPEQEFDLRGVTVDASASQRLLDTGETMLLLDIPAGFGADLAIGRQTDIQLLIDATNSALAVLAASYAERVVAGFGRDLARSDLRPPSPAVKAPHIELDERILFNPNRRESWFMIVAELLNLITLFCILLPGAALVREKERGTVEQLMVSPLSPAQIMLPKVMSMSLVILGATALGLGAVGIPLFGLPVRGSLLLFFAITTLYVFTVSGLGLFIATLARNMAQVGMMTILVFGPMMFLSGAWTPPEGMPELIRNLMWVSPLYHFLEVAFGIFFRGAGAALLWDSIASIALLGSILFTLGVWRFRRQFG
jgi:ABC-2 type transport system permease protein